MEGLVVGEQRPLSNAERSTSAYSWYVVGVLTLTNVVGFVDRQILSLLVPAIERDLRISDTQMSYLIGLSFSVFYTLVGFPVARWADRASRRNIMALGIALWSVMTMLSGVAKTYPTLLMTRIGVGVGEATNNAPGISLIADYFPRERLGTAMSVYSLGIFLGSGLAYLVGGQIVGLVQQEGMLVWPVVGAIRPWQSVFFIVGAPGLAVALIMLTVREPRRDREAQAAVPLRAFLAYVRENRRTFFSHGVGFGLSGTVNFGIAAWLATFLIRTYGFTPARAGTVQGVLTMTVGVAGVIIGGRVADWFARRGHADAAMRVGIIGAAGMLVSATAYPLMPSAGLTIAWLAVVNFFAAFPWGAASAAAAEIVPASMRAQGVAVYFFVLSLVSATLGPTAVALITDHVFRDPAALRYSLVVVNVAGMASAIALLAWGRPAFRETIRRTSVSAIP
jgi:MFS family permease